MSYTLHCKMCDGTAFSHTTNTRQGLTKYIAAGHAASYRMYITSKGVSRALRSDLATYRAQCPSRIYTALKEQQLSVTL